MKEKTELRTLKDLESWNDVDGLKQPKISEETDEFIEFEIPAGKIEEYNLPEGCFRYGDGESIGEEEKQYFEYWVKTKLKGEQKCQ